MTFLTITSDLSIHLLSFQCGWTALMWACYKGHTLVASELLDRGANPNIKADVSRSIKCVYIVNMLFHACLRFLFFPQKDFASS